MQVPTTVPSPREALRQIEKRRALLYAERAQKRQRLSRIRREVRRRARERFAREPENEVTWLIQWVALGLPDETRSTLLYSKQWKVPRLAGKPAPPGEEETPWRRWNREIHQGHSQIRQIEKELERLDEERRRLMARGGGHR